MASRIGRARGPDWRVSAALPLLLALVVGCTAAPQAKTDLRASFKTRGLCAWQNFETRIHPDVSRLIVHAVADSTNRLWLPRLEHTFQ